MDPFPPEALLAAYPPGHQTIANELRRLVKHAVPDAIERVRPGWGLIGYDVPFGRRTRYFAFIWPEPQHVHLGFEHGVLMEDPDGLLQGAGVTKQVRWLTFETVGDIPPTAADLIREAVRVAVMSRSERLARQMDRDELAAAAERSR